MTARYISSIPPFPVSQNAWFDFNASPAGLNPAIESAPGSGLPDRQGADAAARRANFQLDNQKRKLLKLTRALFVVMR